MTSDVTLSTDPRSESIPALDAPAELDAPQDSARDLDDSPADLEDSDESEELLQDSDDQEESDSDDSDDELLSPELRFTDLDLPEPLLRAVADLDFVTPSPIQAAAIPALLAGRDITGVAQTGTGKTAAFGLPLLAAIQPRQRQVQALVLTPTRELAMQVAEALASFATRLPDVDVVAVYGGAPFPPQRDALRKGAQIVVGTPGRVIDHLERHTLDLSGLTYLVLDEADEMLRMGFAEDVDRILSDAPSDRQTALFSATMPPAIRSIAASHLRNPVDIAVARQSSTVENVTQTYAIVPFRQKVDVLARILQMNEGTAANVDAGRDASTGDAQKPATIVFVRTKQACDEVGAELVARGVTAAALNGDVPQKERERIIERLRDGRLDVLVATDVAARGLDVERIDLVVNFDAPLEPESYVHRIGRTGRAGRTGQALTFFTPREVGRLRAIERATRQKITQVTPPTASEVATHRLSSMLRRAVERSDAGLLSNTRRTVSDFLATGQATAEELAVALLALSIGDEGRPMAEPEAEHTFDERTRGGDRPSRGDRPGGRGDRSLSDRGGRRREGPIGPRYRLAVGHRDGVRPAGIVGALTGESDLRGADLGKIDIYDTFSLVEINSPLSDAALNRLGAAKVSGRALRIQPDTGGARRTGGAAHAPGQHGPRTPRRFGKDKRGGDRRD